MEKFLYVFAVLAVNTPNSQALQLICTSEKCMTSAAKILENMDKEVDPCTDFYKFTCGNFIKNAIIPEDKTTVSSFYDIYDRIDEQLKEIFEEPLQKKDAKSLKLVKTVYQSCVDTSKIEFEGLGFVKTIFKDLGGWPLLERSWDEKNFDWKSTLYRLQKLGWRQTMFFSMLVETDSRDPSKNILRMAQYCSPLKQLKQLEKGFNGTEVQALYKYLVELAVLFGADHASAADEMKEVVDFEISLAKIIVPNEKRKDREEYNPVSVRELQQLFPSIPWLQFINSYLFPTDMFRSDDIINLPLPEFFGKFESLMLSTPKRVLANYMFSFLLRDSIVYLPQAFRVKKMEYSSTIRGLSKRIPRWKECIGEVYKLDIAVYASYVSKVLDMDIKDQITELTLDIEETFFQTLKRVDWMDEKTKKLAFLKAEKMDTFIGFSEELLDESKVEGYYERLDLDPEASFLKLSFNLSLFHHMKDVEELREPVTNKDWRLQIYNNYANAYYQQTSNQIVLPAPVLQEDFFNPYRPQFMNYATIGQVMAHEITHGFDNEGRKYDQDGNESDWWSLETTEKFSQESQCFAAQYSNFTQIMRVRGSMGVDENIADNGGIKIAYKAYLKWLDRNKMDMALTGLPYNEKQLFWISAAANWCMKHKEEPLKHEGHFAPNLLRVAIPFMNSEFFARDFNCPLGSPMNPQRKCQIW